MSLDPSLAVQSSVNTLLSAITGLTVYDWVPQAPSYPFCVIGNDQVLLGDSYQFSATTDIHVVVEVWSKNPGKVEVKTLAAQVLEALNQNIPLVGFTVITSEYQSTHYMTHLDQSALYQQAIVEVKYEVLASSE